MRVRVGSKLTSQEKVISERVIQQLQETEYLYKLENRLVKLINAFSQQDNLKKQVIKDQTY